MLENLQNNDFNILSVEGMPWNSQIFYPRGGQNTSRYALFQRLKCTNILTEKLSCGKMLGGSTRVDPSHPRTHSLKKPQSTCWAAALYSGSHVSRAGGVGRRRPLQGSRPRQWPAPGWLDRSVISVYRLSWWWISGSFYRFCSVRQVRMLTCLHYWHCNPE